RGERAGCGGVGCAGPESRGPHIEYDMEVSNNSMTAARRSGDMFAEPRSAHVQGAAHGHRSRSRLGSCGGARLCGARDQRRGRRRMAGPAGDNGDPVRGGQAHRPARGAASAPPGGRAPAPAMADTLGQPIVVENVGGAGGMTGTARVAKAAADGYVFVLGNVGTHAVNQSLYPHPLYDAARDFAPVASLADTPQVLI